MTGTVKLPGIGPVKKGYAYAGGAAVLVIVGYAYYKRRQSGSPTASTTTDTSNIDPATGFPYGSAQDTAALGGAYGGFGPYNPPPPPAPGGPPPITTNAEWAQEVTSGLQGIGWSAETVAEALGVYLARKDLTRAQATIVQVAVAEYGPPPVGSYQIKVGGGGGHPPDKTKPVPNVVGQRGENAHDILNKAGFSHVTETRPRGAHPNSTTQVTSQRPHAGTKADPDTTTVHIDLKVVK